MNATRTHLFKILKERETERERERREKTYLGGCKRPFRVSPSEREREREKRERGERSRKRGERRDERECPNNVNVREKERSTNG